MLHLESSWHFRVTKQAEAVFQARVRAGYSGSGSLFYLNFKVRGSINLHHVAAIAFASTKDP